MAPTGAPVFPNLVQEATLGYDVQISFPAVPLFFQYKLPELMTRASAFEIANRRCPGLTLEFFRIALMRRDVSDQLKVEDIYPAGYETFAEVAEHLPKFIEQIYNTKRLHSALGYLSPTEFETQLAQQAA